MTVALISCQSKPSGPPKPPQEDSNQGEQGMGFPKSVEEYLGKGTIESIKNATTGQSMTVSSKKSQTGTLLAGYPILAQGRDLNKQQIELLKKLLLDSHSYIFPSAKKVLIAPKYGIKLGEVTILLDTTNLLIAFPLDGKSRVEDFDPIKNQIQSLVNELF
jgi:hypothetical protein